VSTEKTISPEKVGDHRGIPVNPRSALRLFFEHHLALYGAYLLLCRQAIRQIFHPRLSYREVLRQLVLIGNASLPIVLLVALFSGMVLALQTAYGMERFGAKLYVGNIVGLGIVRELGPVLAAVMVCGRIGAGIAAEIASMVVTEQVDAMRTLGADPIRKLVAPRLLAAMIAMPTLAVFADAFGIYGGLLIAVHDLDLTVYQYSQSLLYTLVIKDITDGLLKSIVFGFLIVTIACFLGLRTRGGTIGVGETTTKAVVFGSIAIFVSNYFITKILILIG
jgi:phospholipid/cholesterol/gamma-HCH transport system permease protein